MRSQSIGQTEDSSRFLRNALTGNWIFSVLSGLTAVLAARPIAAFMGIALPAALVAIGVGVLLFGAGVWWLTRRPRLEPSWARLVLILDVVWVVASIAVLLAGWPPLSVAGRWTVALVAEAVAAFAVLEFVGLRRL